MENRKLNKRIESETEVFAVDEKGAGNANHEYLVWAVAENSIKDICPLVEISFQNGTIQEAGVNGIQIEDLLVICIDRLEGFQAGNFPCQENAVALRKLEGTLLWLNRRTRDQTQRQVDQIQRQVEELSKK